VSGDPGLYDSTLSGIEEVVERGTVTFGYDVVAGITSVSALTARHRTALTRVARPVHLTTGRRLAQEGPVTADDIVVMLDAHCAFADLSEEFHIYWGAYLGTPDEILVAGPVPEVADRIRELRAEARERKGWIMDTYLPIVEGRVFMERPQDGPPKPVLMGADGIAISADGKRLFYCPLMSRHLYSVSADALADRSVGEEEVAATVVDEGDKGGSADGLETDDAGRVYITNWEHNAIMRRLPDGTFETLVHDPRLLWPDTMSVAQRHLYVTSNQLHRQAAYQNGQDLRRYPYALFRTPIDAGPVRLL
jgi:hypothetical protein